MDDQVATMRRIWAGEAPFEGADPVGPPPVQPGGPPLAAGVMGPKAIDRAARWAQGVDDPTTITSIDAEALAERRQRIVDAWQGAGRDTPPHFSASLWYALGPDAERQLGDYVFNYLKIFSEGFARHMAESAPVPQRHGPAPGGRRRLGRRLRRACSSSRRRPTPTNWPAPATRSASDARQAVRHRLRLAARTGRVVDSDTI